MTSDLQGAERIALLTDAQCEVLRLFQERRTAKEIGRALGITHWAVNERLRAARRVLGVASSGEAARLLAVAESGGTYKRIVCDPPAIAAVADHVIFSTPDEGDGGSSGAIRGSAVREEQVAYRLAYEPRFRLPLPRYRGDRNDLNRPMRLLWIAGIALGFVAVLGALITISSGVVRLVSQIIRTFA